MFQLNLTEHSLVGGSMILVSGDMTDWLLMLEHNNGSSCSRHNIRAMITKHLVRGVNIELVKNIRKVMCFHIKLMPSEKNNIP